MMRQALGCVTLAVAIACIYPWLRSHRYFDAYHCPISPTISMCLMSVAGSLTISFDIHEDGDNNASSQHYDLRDNWRFQIPIRDWFDAFSQFEGFMAIFRLNWRCCGFGVGTCLDGPSPHPLFAIPYWSIVVSMTMLSGWLLWTRRGLNSSSKTPVETA
jgi:hypothetical protein